MHPSDWFLLWNVCQWLTDLPSGSLLSLLCPVLWIKWSGSRFVRGVLSEGGSSGGVAMTADEGGPGWRSPSVLLYPSSGLSVHRAHWGLCRPPESPCINSVAGCPGFSSSAILHLPWGVLWGLQGAEEKQVTLQSVPLNFNSFLTCSC